MARLVIVSNRTPPVRGTLSAGGLAVALRDAIQGRETLWFGWSGTTAAGEAPAAVRSHTTGRLTIATIDLGQSDYQGYYRGFSNGMLWPLLHYRAGLTEFRREDRAAYLAVNATFAQALAGLLRPDDVVWAHDYHLFPLGAALRAHGIGCRLGFFLHVPFPPLSVFEVLPAWQDLLRDLGAYDVLGVQTLQDAANLTDALAQLGIPRVAEAFPIGIDPEGFAAAARKAAAGPEAERLRESLVGRALIFGVDRLDYSKGLPERFRGYERLLKRFPQHHRQITMMQIAPVSRGDVATYRALRKQLDEVAGRINGEYGEFDWTPVRYMTRGAARNTLAGFDRIARVGLVTPLRDGMNLVAKEYVAAQDPEDPGALVLSLFAGAAPELDGALLVNPHDPDETAEALHQALIMPHEERRARWRSMYQAVRRNTAASWAHSFLDRLEERAAAAA